MALAIAAHPDDVEFGCGGTLAKWAAAGTDIHHLVCTDGSKGSWDPAEDQARLVAIRQEEQRNASRALGGKGDVVFLGWPDGELEVGPAPALGGGVLDPHAPARRGARSRPVAPLPPPPRPPQRRLPRHRRHRGRPRPALLPRAGRRAPPPVALLLWEADEPDHVEDVTAFVDTKLAALMEHRSQFRSTMRIDDPTATDEVEKFSARIRLRLGEQGALAGVDFGEAFKLMRNLKQDPNPDRLFRHRRAVTAGPSGLAGALTRTTPLGATPATARAAPPPAF